MNRLAPKLQGMQSKTAKNAGKSSSHLRNTVKSTSAESEKGRSSESTSTTSWNVFCGENVWRNAKTTQLVSGA